MCHLWPALVQSTKLCHKFLALDSDFPLWYSHHRTFVRLGPFLVDKSKPALKHIQQRYPVKRAFCQGNRQCRPDSIRWLVLLVTLVIDGLHWLQYLLRLPSL